MTDFKNYVPNPALDLVLQRDIDVPRDLVWAAWTQPEHLKVWFTPRPWTVSDSQIDLRPGGMFKTTMCSPEGESFPNVGCFLVVEPNELLVFTDALLPDFRPAAKPFMTAIIRLEKIDIGTRYTAIVMHHDEAGRKSHEEMGFHPGWNAALDQLIAHVKTM